MIKFYVIGVIVSFILGCILIFKEEDKKNTQYEMIAPMALLSWITVVLILWKYRDKFLA